ncbi:MAG: hypothetical protein ACLQKK_08010 [Rhodomicrobium sp.]
MEKKYRCEHKSDSGGAKARALSFKAASPVVIPDPLDRFAIRRRHPGSANGVIRDRYELGPAFFAIPDKRKSVFRDDGSGRKPFSG